MTKTSCPCHAAQYVPSDYQGFEDLLFATYGRKPRIIQMIFDVLALTGWQIDIPWDEASRIASSPKGRAFVYRWEDEIEDETGPQGGPSRSASAYAAFMAAHTLAAGLALPYADSEGFLYPEDHPLHR